MKSTKADWYHILIGLAAFIFGWYIWSSAIGLLFSITLGILKEINDEYGFFPIFFTSKNPKMDTWDIAKTMLLPFFCTVFDYLFLK